MAKLPIKRGALKRWMATDILWNRKVVSLLLPVMLLILRPRSDKNATAELFSVHQGYYYYYYLSLLLLTKVLRADCVLM
jgi:hypothetical protein